MKKQIFSIALVITVCFLIIHSNLPDSSFAIQETNQSLAFNVELTIDYGNSTQEVFPNRSGSTVFDILNQTTRVAFSQYLYGKFVTSINDIENNANNNGYYWQYWVNDQLAPIAADNYFLSDGDRVLWKYCAPELTPTISPSLGPELLWGLGIIGIFCVITVVAAFIIYIKMR